MLKNTFESLNELAKLQNSKTFETFIESEIIFIDYFGFVEMGDANCS